MTYINPFQFIEPPLKSLEEYEPSMLKKARQRLLAEFELSEDGVIELEGKTLEKSSALDRIDALADEAKRAAHWEIWQNEALRDFLAYPSSIRLANLSIKQLELSKMAWSLVAEPMADELERILKKGLENRAEDLVVAVMQKAQVMPTKECERLEKPVVQLLEAEWENWAEVHTQLYLLIDADHSKLEGLNSMFWPNVLNSLSMLYQLKRNEFARMLGEIGMMLIGDDDALALQIIEVALHVNADPELLDDIRSGFSAEKKAQKPEKQAEKSGNAGVGVGIAFVVIVIFLIKLGTSISTGSDSSSSKSRFRPSIDFNSLKRPSSLEQLNSQRNTTIEIEYKQLMDSLLQHAKNPVPKLKKSKVRRPITGTGLYREFTYEAGARSSENLLELVNNSKKDVVMILENGQNLLEEAIFIRAGDYYELRRRTANGLVLTVYNGDQWQENLFKIYSSKHGYVEIPGFVNGTEFLGREQLGKTKAPLWVYDFLIGPITNYKVEFDGKALNMQKRPIKPIKIPQ